MKFKWLLLSLIFTFTFISCDKDDPVDEGNGFPEYSVAIMSPSADAFSANESFHIHVNFDEASELTIHHINVQITDEQGTVLYNMPTNAHVHNDSGHHEHHDDFVPAVEIGSTLTLVAKVWGHEAGISETVTSHSFKVE